MRTIIRAARNPPKPRNCSMSPHGASQPLTAGTDTLFELSDAKLDASIDVHQLFCFVLVHDCENGVDADFNSAHFLVFVIVIGPLLDQGHRMRGRGGQVVTVAAAPTPCRSGLFQPVLDVV